MGKPRTSTNRAAHVRLELDGDHGARRIEIFRTLHDAGIISRSTQDRDRVVTAILRKFDAQNGILAGDAYVIWHTVASCNIDIANVVQDSHLAAIWEDVRAAASTSEERTGRKRKRSPEATATSKSADEGISNRRDYEPDVWRSVFAAAKTIGMDRMVHYGWIPRSDSDSGRSFLFDLQSAVHKAGSWSVLVRRISAVQWVMYQDRVPFRPSKFSNRTCLVQQSHLKAVQKWEGGRYRGARFKARDVELSQAQIDEMGCEKDCHGLLRYKKEVDADVPTRDKTRKRPHSKDIREDQDPKRMGAEDKAGKASKDKANAKTDERMMETANIKATRMAAVATAAKAPAHAETPRRMCEGTQRQKDSGTKETADPKLLQHVEDAEDPLGDLNDLMALIDNHCASDKAENDQDHVTARSSTGRGDVEPSGAIQGETSVQAAAPHSSDGDRGSEQRLNMPSFSELHNDFENSRQKILTVLSELQTLGGDDGNGSNHAHYSVAIEWMERVRLPRVGDISTVLHGGAEVDVVELSSEELARLLDSGHIIDLPVVLRGQLHHLSEKDITQYIREMKRCRERVEVQWSGEALTKEIRAEDGLGIIEEEMAEPSMYIASSAPTNFLNLRDLARAQKAVIFEHPRWRLLQMLDRVALSDPGKQLVRRPSDVISCEAFNLLASTGSFSRPHMDYLGGTWVRMLSPSGLKLWNTAVHLTATERHEFLQSGAAYVPPEGKAVAVALQMGDLLIMPPATLQVHAPLTLSPSLMDGGMFWDQDRIVKILQHLLLVALNPEATNEPIPQELPATLASLKALVVQDYAIYEGESGKAFQDEFWAVLGEFTSKVACHCNPKSGKGCDRVRCTCHRRGSRCTNFCGGHTKVKRCCKIENHELRNEDTEGSLALSK